MPAASIETIRHREVWTFAECAAVWGYPAKFFKDLYARGEVTGIRPEGRKRVKLSAVSVRAYFERQRVTTRPQPVKSERLTIKEQAARSPRVLAARAARGIGV